MLQLIDKWKRRQTTLIAFVITMNLTSTCWGHPTGMRAGDAWWTAWNFDSLVVFNLLLFATIYARGLIRLWGRNMSGGVVSRLKVLAFASGLVAIAMALLSPLDTLSNDLAWVHMLQHMTLMVVAAPLLALSSPGLVCLWALPKRWRRWRQTRLARQLNFLTSRLRELSWQPLFIWILHAAILWGWHIPATYQLALMQQWVHDLEHVSFFVVAVLFWRVILDARQIPTLNPGLGVIYLFTTSLHAMVLGVLMALAPRVWYPIYAGRAERWGLSALEDQQLAGLIMWMPACLIYAIAAVALFARWLHRMELKESDRWTTV